MLLILVSLTLAAVVSSAPVQPVSDLKACTVDFGGHTYDFSSLRNATGAYTWSETLYAQGIGGNLLSQDDLSDATTLGFELQICAPVTHSKCVESVTSAINQIDAQGNCTSLGDAHVGGFGRAPYNDGFYLSYFMGSMVSNIQRYESRVYLICDPTQFGTPPFLEHEKAGTYQYHFKFFTKLACDPSK